MDALGPPAQRIGTRRVPHTRSVRARAVEVKQARSPPAPEPQPDDRIALESVDIVPLPSPLLEKSAVVPVSSLESFVSLDEAPAERDNGLFSLDKTQSLWLLNLVSFAYGSNTTCAPARCALRFANRCSRAFRLRTRANPRRAR